MTESWKIDKIHCKISETHEGENDAQKMRYWHAKKNGDPTNKIQSILTKWWNNFARLAQVKSTLERQ